MFLTLTPLFDSPTPLQAKALASLIYLISEAFTHSMVFTHAFKTERGLP